MNIRLKRTEGRKRFSCNTAPSSTHLLFNTTTCITSLNLLRLEGSEFLISINYSKRLCEISRTDLTLTGSSYEISGKEDGNPGKQTSNFSYFLFIFPHSCFPPWYGTLKYLYKSDGFALLIDCSCDTRDRGFFNPEKYKVT